MKTLIISFVLFLFVVIFSCKKKETTSVKVIVIETCSNRGWPNKTVFLLQGKHKKNNPPFGGNSPLYDYSVLEKGITNAAGQIDFGGFQSYKSSNYDYFVSIAPDWANQDLMLEKNADNSKVINYRGTVNLTLNFIPPPPYGTADSLRINIQSCSNNPYHTIITNINYSSFHEFGLSSGLNYFNIDKYKSGVYTNIKDTVSYNPESNYTYNFNW